MYVNIIENDTKAPKLAI